MHAHLEANADAVARTCNLDFGPPRRVDGWTGYEAEVRRQEKLVEAGYLRRARFATWGWQEYPDTGEWFWRSNGNYWLSEHRRFSEYEAAWMDLLAERTPVLGIVKRRLSNG
jgi:hypothetical protein